MTGKNITRIDLADAIYHKVGLSHTGSADLVGQVLEAFSASLTVAGNVKLSGFGVFAVRDRAERAGRNSKPGKRCSLSPADPSRLVPLMTSRCT